MPLREVYNSHAQKGCSFVIVRGGNNQLPHHRAMWTQLHPIILSGSPPKPRHCHSATSMGSHILYFGGTDGKDRYNDVYIFDTVKCGWQLLKTRGDIPSPRYCASICSWQELVILFGGFDSQRLNTLHVLDIRTCEWTAKTVTGTVPGPRSHHTMVVSGSKAYVFGGLRNDGKVLNDLFALDLERWAWVQLNPGGPLPRGRLGHIGCLLDNNCIFVFGGYDGKARLNDCYILRLDALCWSEPLVAGFVPSKRLGHSGAALGNRVVIFGGDDGNTDRTLLSDVHIFDFSSLRWFTLSNGPDAPAGRIHSTLSLVGAHDLFLFAGSGNRKPAVETIQLLHFETKAQSILSEIETALQFLKNGANPVVLSSRPSQVSPAGPFASVHRMNELSFQLLEVNRENSRDSDVFVGISDPLDGVGQHNIEEALSSRGLKDSKRLDHQSEDAGKDQNPPASFPSVAQDMIKLTSRNADSSVPFKDNPVYLSAESSPSASPTISPRILQAVHPIFKQFGLSPSLETLDYVGNDLQTTLEHETRPSDVLDQLGSCLTQLKQAYSSLCAEKEEFMHQLTLHQRALDESLHRRRIQDARIEEVVSKQGALVTLNVGGCLYQTTTATLTREKSSMLAAMFSGKFAAVKDQDGTYFIDRDGQRFRYVLSYLRSGADNFILEPRKSLYIDLIQDATFFQLEGLRNFLVAHLDSGLIVDEPVVDY